MKSDNQWEKEVEKSMDLLSQVGRVQPSAGFEEAVLEKLQSAPGRSFYWGMPAIAAGLVLLIGLNLFSLFSKSNHLSTENSSPVTSFYQLEEGGDFYDQILKR